MAKPAPKAETIKKSDKRWQSDIIVDMIKRYDFEYIALNPGASYRGLHDSLVNHGENDPPMLLCQHEKIAVQIAHGYARAKGKPMIAIVHNLVGLLHAPMGVYYAYLDRAPVFLIGATGPMAEPKRRPFIDWIHTANGQGEAIRNFVKWDYQPSTVDGVPGAFARAYSVMMSARQGPIYMVYDAGLQEAQLDHDVEMPPPDAVTVPTAPAADPVALDKSRRHARRRQSGRDHRRLRRPSAARLEPYRRVGRNFRRVGLGRRIAAQFPERPSAQPHLGF